MSNKNSGFTLIEMLLGITISVMIFLTASSLILLLFNTDVNAKRVQTIEQTKYVVGQELSTAIKWASSVEFGSDQITIDGSTIYKLEDGQLKKDGTAITPSNVVIESLDIKDYSVSSALKSLEITMEIYHSSFPTLKDNYKIVASQRLLTISEDNFRIEPSPTPTGTPGTGDSGDDGDIDTGDGSGGDGDGGEGPPPGR